MDPEVVSEPVVEVVEPAVVVEVDVVESDPADAVDAAVVDVIPEPEPEPIPAPIIDITNGVDLDDVIFTADPQLYAAAVARYAEMIAFMTKLGIYQMRTQVVDSQGVVYKLLVSKPKPEPEAVPVADIPVVEEPISSSSDSVSDAAPAAVDPATTPDAPVV